MSKILNAAIAALSVCILLSAANVQAQQVAPGREPSPGRDPGSEPKVPREEPVPFHCGALLLPCIHGPLRPDQNPQVDPHEPTKPNPKDPGTLPKTLPKPKPAPTPVPPNEPHPNEGPTNKPGNPDDDW